MSTFLYAIFLGLLLTGQAFGTPPSLQAEQAHTTTRSFFPKLDPTDVDNLLQGSPLNQTFGRAVTTRLAPEVTATERIHRTTTAVSPSFGLEALYFHPSTRAHKLAPERLYNLTRAISTMEGLEYTVENSSTRKILYKEAYAINNPQSARRVPDPVVRKIPAEASLYALQDDEGFGRNMYRVTHFYDSGAIHIQMSNLTTIRMGFIPVIRPDLFILQFIVLPTESGIYFYANGAMRAPAIMSGFGGTAQEGLRVRIDALFDWFVQELESAIAEDL
ncbi:MAG: hypothetical protein EA428_12965 [Spirochaetaceae bacterium]|nr:MAG: hypothetical protein EA428_12965 [Spirochaetaceae bacterium]